MRDAQTWLRRWDEQQETYMPDREERFDVLADLVQTRGPAPRVLDLGCGPGSLSTRLLARLPEATVLGVDSDPVLLTLARAQAPAGLTLLDADLRTADWSSALGDDRFDAIVSTTALHWLTAERLRAVYADCHRLLREGGLFADGDHFHDERVPTLTALSLELDGRRSARHGGAGEDWRTWWEAVVQEPELRDAVRERARRQIEHPPSEKRLAVHESALHDAGFVEVGIVWRKGTDAVLVATG